MEDHDVLNFEHIVVGGGVMGLCSSRHLAQSIGGKRILLLDQFPLPHSRGSSHGHTRIYRTAYHHPVLTDMARDAIRQWHEIEEAENVQLLHNCGVLITGVKTIVDRAESSLISSKSPYEKYTFAELLNSLRCHQQLQNYPRDQTFLLDRSGGIMLAKDCMEALLRNLRSSGVSIRNEVVSDVFQRKSGSVEVVTDRDRYICRSVILTVGAWSTKFMSQHLGIHVPLEPTLVAALYWRVQESSKVSFRAEHFPPLIDYYDEDPLHHLYALPELEYPRCIKVSHQKGSLVDPDHRDKVRYPETIMKELSEYLSRHLPLIDSSSPSIHEACLYTQSPDYIYVLDRSPQSHNIIIGAGFSGNGFKMGPIVGKILSSLAMDKDPGYDLSDFSVKRFGRMRHAL